MDKIIPHCCPRCNSKKLYKYGKDKFGNQKYQCRVCKHQFAPGSISSGSNGAKPLPPEQRKYPSCPICEYSTQVEHPDRFELNSLTAKTEQSSRRD